MTPVTEAIQGPRRDPPVLAFFAKLYAIAAASQARQRMLAFVDHALAGRGLPGAGFQSGYSSLRQARGSSAPGFGVRSSRKEWYGATNGSGAETV